MSGNLKMKVRMQTFKREWFRSLSIEITLKDSVYRYKIFFNVKKQPLLESQVFKT